VASRRLDWWLRPAGRDPKHEIAGVALALNFYALFLGARSVRRFQLTLSKRFMIASSI
jgi:hypothetical protein